MLFRRLRVSHNKLCNQGLRLATGSAPWPNTKTADITSSTPPGSTTAAASAAAARSTSQLSRKPERTPGGVEDDAVPPMPPNYVPIDQRPADDESLLFLRKAGTLPGRERSVNPLHDVSDGLLRAPTLPERPTPSVRYVDDHARRLKTTSIGAGQPLVSSQTEERLGGAHRSRNGHPPVPGTLPPSRPPESNTDTNEATGAADGTTFRAFESPRSPSSSTTGSVFEPKNSVDDDNEAVAASGEHGSSASSNRTTTAQRPLMDELAADMARLQYYEGDPRHRQMVQEFKKKYSAADLASAGQLDQKYSAREISSGLLGEPLDLARLSPAAKSVVLQGPHAYHPVNLMQQYGTFGAHGYAFHPALELGKAGSDELHTSRPDFSLAAKHLQDEVQGVAAHKDTSLLHRWLGISTWQRRQMKLCLTDIDRGDPNVTMHVMRSYPFTGYLWAIYTTCLFGFLYYVQVKFRMFAVYDEYLGLDLRQAPKLEKPMLLAITVFFGGFFFFHPLTLLSIATTRVFRIFMGRPVGPP